MAMVLDERCCEACWHSPTRPCPQLIECLLDGPLCHESEACAIRRRESGARQRRETVARPAIFVGAGTCGLGAGAGKTLDAVRSYLDERNIAADVIEVGCIGLCAAEPMLDVQLPGRTRLAFMHVTHGKVAGVLDGVFAGDATGGQALGQHRGDGLEPWADVPYVDEHPFFGPQTRWVLANCGVIDPAQLDEYIARGGYRAFSRMARTMTPAEACKVVADSGLRGRGGGGFPTGRKWQFALGTSAEQKYLVCNADEGDPGAFMDRAVIEGDPHRLLEGIAIASYAIGATKAYIYIRAEYPLAIRRLEKAIQQAEALGLLGHDILGSGFNLGVVIKQGAGAFVCGEETALLHSIEGKRGMPRPRPPFPAVSGAFGKPTVINNVETLANVPGILDRGAEWFSAVGTDGSKGTKVFALSGRVELTGLVEVAMGTTLREVVFDIGGGVPNGKAFKAVQIGGPSGGCIPAQHLDIEIDYESLKAVGAIMGSGGLVVMDEGTCMVDLAKFFMDFIQRESCGKCIPCREGTKRMLEILQRITSGRRSEDGEAALERFRGVLALGHLAEVIRDASLCGLGQTAPNPVLSTLRWFRDEYEAHVYDRWCPAGVCRELVGAPCQNTCPLGTEVWRYVAHVARGEYGDAYRVIREANPFPSICARVCHHPCENKCRCGTTGGEPIAVRTLKRFVVDRVPPEAYVPEVRPATSDAPRIAVVGAGPAGLTAAHCLGAMGCRVTLFEREAEPGGMLVAAIPEYRLPRDTLHREIHALLNANIELRCGQALGRDFTLDDLLGEQGYRAVYLALGSHESRKLGVPGEDTADGVIPGIEFLKAHNLHGQALARGRVGIVGGGNSAVDAARVAVRQHGVESVTIFYRRTRAEMPAYQEEIEAALAEGAILTPLVAPVEILSRDGRVSAVRLIANRLGDLDASGRPRPVPVPGSEHVVELDTLIAAIGEQPEADGLSDLALTRRGLLMTHPDTSATSRRGVFAGGDLATGPNTVVDAIAAGKKAAGAIADHLAGRARGPAPRVKLPTTYVEPVEVEEQEGEPIRRVEPPQLPAERRVGSFAEVELCISESRARAEARRCLRCDLDFTRPL